MWSGCRVSRSDCPSFPPTVFVWLLPLENVPVTETLSRFTEDLAAVLPDVDANTTGQYGAGIGSKDEPEQLRRLLAALRETDAWYGDLDREVAYPDGAGRCDLVLPDGTPVEAKLLRYWRANGDPEPHMYTHVFSPFATNTLLTDAQRVTDFAADDTGALLGLYYDRAADDPTTVSSLPKRYTPADLAAKVVADIEFWYDLDATVAAINRVAELQHRVHKRAAVITWTIEP